MAYRNYRGKRILVKKGGVNIQLCAQERSLLKEVLENALRINAGRAEDNKIVKRDCTYLQKILGKVMKKKEMSQMWCFYIKTRRI